MRQGTLLCLAALVASAVAYGGYLTGHEYVYSYEASIFKELNTKHHQHSGFFFKSKVHVQPHDDFFIIKIDDLVYDKANLRVVGSESYDYNYREHKEFSELIEKPFKVYFEHGLVKRIVFSRSDIGYSINLKKGLISLLQLNLDQVNVIQRHDKDHVGNLAGPEVTSHYFKAMETGVSGECETLYEIGSDEDAFHTEPVFNITKSRNYENCVKQPYLFYHSSHYDTCGECTEQDHPIHLSDIYYYNMKGNRMNFIIERVDTVGELYFMPYTFEGERPSTQANRTLQLLFDREVGTSEEAEFLSVSGDVVSDDTLLFEFPYEHNYLEVVDLEKAHYLFHLLGQKANIEDIGQLFLQLTNSYTDVEFAKNLKEKRLPIKFLEIVKMFSTLDLKDIQAFDTQYVHKERSPGEKISKEQAAKYSIFTDILSVTGTNPAILFFKRLIQKKVLPAQVVQHFLQVLPQSIKEPHEVLLDEIYKLCQKEITQLYPRQKSACHLSLSAIVYESCVHSYHEHQKFPSTAKRICTPEDAVKYFNYIIGDYNDPSLTELERITAIKAAGNFGLKKGIYFLRNYIHHFDYSTFFRLSAVFALRRTVDSYPELVREILVPVYFNHSEPNELRIAAFTIIIGSSPDLVLLDTIGQALYREQSRQVTSYVKSVFYHLSHSDYPCYREIKKHIQIVMRHLEHLEYKFSYDIRNSFAYISSGYDARYGYGGASTFSFVTSNDSYIPSMVYYGASEYVSGKHYDTFSVAYHGFGLDKFFDKLFGPKGLYQSKSLFDIFKRRVARDTASVEKELKEIDDRLHIKNREPEPVHGDISMRVFGNEISFFHFDEHIFDNFEREGAFGVPDVEDYLRDVKDFSFKRFVIARDHLLFIPLEIGLPAFLNYKEPALLYYHNDHFKFDVQPSIFSDKRNNEAPSTVSLGVNGYLAFDKLKQATLGVFLPFESVSIGVGRVSRQVVSIPLNFEFTYDLKEHKFSFKDHKTAFLPHNILHKCSYPITYIDNLANRNTLVEEESLLPYFKKDEMKKEEYNFFHDALGFGYHVEGYHGDLHIFRSKGDFRKFMAENDLRHKLYYLMFDPYMTSYDFDVTLTADPNHPTNEIEYTLNYDHHDSMVKDNKPYRSAALTFEDGSEEHLKSYPGRKVYTNVFKGGVVLKGDKEKKVTFEIAYTHTCDHLYQKVNIYYERTPFTSQETEPFKACISANLRYPEYDIRKLYNLDTLDLDQKINAALLINYGKDCQSDKKITVKGVLKKSEEQIRLEQQREVVDPLHFNPYAHYYKLCLKARETLKHHYAVPCRKYIYYATKMHKYLINMEHEGQASDSFLNTIPRIQSFVDHSLYYYMDQDRYGINNDPNKEKIEIVFSVTGDRGDLHIQRPHDDTRFTQVPIPKCLTPLSASPLLSYTNLAKYWTVFRKPFCAVEGDVVRTFDNVTYHLPEIGCYKVIAKDCSVHEYFSVLGKKTTNPKYGKALKAFIGKNKVEILAVSDDSELIVRVDGKAVTVTTTEPYFYFTGEGDHQVELFHIVYNGLYYTVLSDYYGLEVYFDGNAIITELSPYYRGKQCGLCGDFNNERHLELLGPEQCVFHNVNDFAYSYAIPQDGCTVPKVQSACEIGAGQRQNCKTYKNKYVYAESRSKQVCFSTVPFPDCATDCVPTKKVRQNVGFYCLNAKDTFARFLQRESRNRPLHEVKNKPENYFTEIEYPEDCVHKIV